MSQPAGTQIIYSLRTPFFFHGTSLSPIASELFWSSCGMNSCSVAIFPFNEAYPFEEKLRTEVVHRGFSEPSPRRDPIRNGDMPLGGKQLIPDMSENLNRIWEN